MGGDQPGSAGCSGGAGECLRAEDPEAAREASRGQRTHLKCEVAKLSKDLHTACYHLPEVLYARVRQVEVDLMEVFAGFAEVSIQFAKKGCSVTEPIDLWTDWDLFRNDHWDRLLTYVNKVKPALIVMAPPCGPWSSLQNLNLHHEGYAARLAKLREHHRVLLGRVAFLYRLQIEHGRHAVIENPWSSRAWFQAELSELLQLPTSFVARCDQCTTGLRGPSNKPLRKRTLFLCTSPQLAVRLSRTCGCSRRGLVHEPIEGGRLSQLAGRYTPHLARLIFKGFRDTVEAQHNQSVQLWPADAEEVPIIEPEPELVEERSRGGGAGDAAPAAAAGGPPPRTQDFWRYSTTARTWLRHHITPRTELCDPTVETWGPDRTHGVPQPEQLRGERRTVFHPVNRPHEVFAREDDWRSGTARARTPWEWTGHTIFYPIALPSPSSPSSPAGSSSSSPNSDAGTMQDDRSAQADSEVEHSGSDTPEPERDDLAGQRPPRRRRVGEEPSNQEVDRALMQVHKNLGHPSNKELMRMLSSVGATEQAMARAKFLRCPTCARHVNRLAQRPARWRLATEFNEHVGLDLFELRDCAGHKFYFLNILDNASRFQLCMPVADKTPSCVVDVFTDLWLQWAGPPRTVTVDQGGEFYGEFTQELESLGVAIHRIPTDAPWQAGATERNGGSWKFAAYKIIEHEQVQGRSDMRRMAYMLNSARNNMVNSTGFSPSQWVLGANPKLPGSLLCQPDSLAEHSNVEDGAPDFRRRMALLRAAQAAMTDVDRSSRLRRALLRKSRPERAPLEKGEQVYVWRRRRSGKKSKVIISSRWVGPCTVIGSEGRSAVWCAYRGGILKVAPEMVRRATPSEVRTFAEIVQEVDMAELLLKRGDRVDYTEVPFDDPGRFEDDLSVHDSADEQAEDGYFHQGRGDDGRSEPMSPGGWARRSPRRAAPSTGAAASEPPPAAAEEEPPEAPPDEFDFPVEPEHWDTYSLASDITGIVDPRDVPVPDTPRRGRKRSRSPSPEQPSSSPPGTPPPPPASRRLRLVWAAGTKRVRSGELRLGDLSASERAQFVVADQEEWSSWLEHEAVQVLSAQEAKQVLDSAPADRILRARMVRRNKNQGKFSADGTAMTFRAKSRLCVLGFLDPDEVRTDAPTLSRLGAHTLFAVAAGLKLRLCSADVSNAFLNGLERDRGLYFRLPPDLQGLAGGTVCRIRKGVYGLRDAPRLWWLRIREVLLEMGFVQLRLEPTLFVLRSEDTNGKDVIEAIVGTHVDDLLIAATPRGHEQVQRLCAIFTIKKFEWDRFTYCGRQVEQDKDFTVRVGMRDYTVNVQKVVVAKARRRDMDAPLTGIEQSQLRGINGALGWLSSQGRPDLSFAVSLSQGKLSKPVVRDLVEANRVVQLAQQGSDFQLVFPPLDLEDACLVVCSDASFANMPGGKSQSGGLVLLAEGKVGRGEKGKIALMDWRSSRQKRACRSTFGAETLAMSDVTDRGDFVRGLWYELMVGGDPREAEETGLEMHWVTDCKDLYDCLSKDGALNTREHRLALEVVILKELLRRPKDFLHWVATDQMLADSLTKDMSSEYLLERLKESEWCLKDAPEVAKRRQARERAERAAARAGRREQAGSSALHSPGV